MKLKRRIATLCATMVMAIGAFGIEAGATGTVKDTPYASSTGYSFSVDGDWESATEVITHYGQRASVNFRVSVTGSYKVTFPGSSGYSTTVNFYRVGAGDEASPVNTVVIPKSAPGMPTLSATVDLPVGDYYVKFVSTSNTGTSSGTFTFYY